MFDSSYVKANCLCHGMLCNNFCGGYLLPFKRAQLSFDEPEGGGGVAQWLGRRISDQGVPGSNSGRCTFRCGLEQVTFTLLSTG